MECKWDGSQIMEGVGGWNSKRMRNILVIGTSLYNKMFIILSLQGWNVKYKKKSQFKSISEGSFIL